MATEKTPAYKRIARAEQSSVDWKMKALERREENERLKKCLKTAESKVLELTNATVAIGDKEACLQKEVTLLSRQLEAVNHVVEQQKEEIVELKKKSHR